MCGAYFLNQSPKLREFYGIHFKGDIDNNFRDTLLNPSRLSVEKLEYRSFRPTDNIPVLVQTRSGELTLQSACWWMLLKKEQNEWRPNQEWSTFNSRLDKILDTGSTIHNQRPYSFRVIIPAQGYFEWQGKSAYQISRADETPLMLAGMAKAYQQANGTYCLGASIVTLRGHHKLAHVHDKSLPLMLENDDVLSWLDRTLPVQHMKRFLEPALEHDLVVTLRRSIVAQEPDLFALPEVIEADFKSL